MNTLIWLSARVVKMRRFTPITPTIESPDTVMRLVLLIELIPLMARFSSCTPCSMIVPTASGWKVFLMRIGMFFTHTGYIVGG